MQDAFGPGKHSSHTRCEYLQLPLDFSSLSILLCMAGQSPCLVWVYYNACYCIFRMFIFSDLLAFISLWYAHTPFTPIKVWSQICVSLSAFSSLSHYSFPDYSLRPYFPSQLLHRQLSLRMDGIVTSHPVAKHRKIRDCGWLFSVFHISKETIAP